MLVRHIPEAHAPGKRLGRHVEHDPRSHTFRVKTPKRLALKPVHHRRYAAVFDQSNLGSCTGQAVAGAVDTAPNHKKGMAVLHEPEAVALYSLATRLDSFPGSYPPDDTGSSGLAACKAAAQMGYISRYEHAFGIDDALAALMARPVITGVDWFEGFDSPAPDGLVEIAGQVRGGHEFEVYGYEPAPAGRPAGDALVLCRNSWGEGYGEHGRFHFTVATWVQLLASGGDVTVPIA